MLLGHAALLAERAQPLASTKLTFLLGISFQLVLAEFTRRLDAAGHGDVRPVHGMTFQVLYRDGATSSELAGRRGITKQASGSSTPTWRNAATCAVRTIAGRQAAPDRPDRQGTAHLEAAGAILHQLESEIVARAGGDTLLALRTELARLIRASTGDSDIPPLRPLW